MLVILITVLYTVDNLVRSWSAVSYYIICVQVKMYNQLVHVPER